MRKMNSKRDVRNWVDGCFQNEVTPATFEAAVDLVVDTAYDMGIEYGDDWSPALESLTIEDLEDAA
jgi:hypothetical protein